MFSKSCKYAIRAMLYLAINTDGDTKADVKSIADALKVPQHFLAKILQHLSRHQLISSTKGPSGGFYASPENLDVPLSEVIECVDGDTVFRACILGLENCSDANPCPLHHNYVEFRHKLLLNVKHQTLRELAEGLKDDGNIRI